MDEVTKFLIVTFAPVAGSLISQGVDELFAHSVGGRTVRIQLKPLADGRLTELLDELERARVVEDIEFDSPVA